MVIYIIEPMYTHQCKQDNKYKCITAYVVGGDIMEVDNPACDAHFGQNVAMDKEFAVRCGKQTLHHCLSLQCIKQWME